MMDRGGGEGQEINPLITHKESETTQVDKRNLEKRCLPLLWPYPAPV